MRGERRGGERGGGEGAVCLDIKQTNLDISL